MAMKTSHKWIIVIVALIVLGIAAYYIYKSIPKQGANVVPPTETTTSTEGLANLIPGIKNLFGNIFGGKPKTDPCASVVCDPNHSGWDMDGFPNNCCS